MTAIFDTSLMPHVFAGLLIYNLLHVFLYRSRRSGTDLVIVFLIGLLFEFSQHWLGFGHVEAKDIIYTGAGASIAYLFARGAV